MTDRSQAAYRALWPLEQQRFYDWALRRCGVTPAEQERIIRMQLPPVVQQFTALEPAGIVPIPPKLWSSMGLRAEFASAEDAVAMKPSALVVHGERIEGAALDEHMRKLSEAAA